MKFEAEPDRISYKQVKRFWALCKSKNYSSYLVYSILKKHGYKEPEQIQYQDYQKICDDILEKK